MSDLGVTGPNLHCEKAMKKRSIVNNNGIGSMSLRISGLGEKG